MSTQLSFLDQPPAISGLFLGVFPTDSVQAQLEDRALALRRLHGLTGAPLLKGRFHFTLLDFGDHAVLPPQLVADITAAAEAVSFPAFTVTLDRAEGWKGSEALVALPAEGREQLEALRDLVLKQLFEARVRVRPVKPQPHLTLLYDPRLIDPQPIEPVRLAATEFRLIQSLKGQTRHVPLGAWPLSG